MAKNIASLAAQVSASAGGFFGTMDRIQSEAKTTANVVNGIKAQATIGANTQALTVAENRLKTIQALAARPAAAPVAGRGGGAMLTVDQTGKIGAGFALKGAMNPAMLAQAVISGSIMRAVTQSEAGHKLLEQIDHITGSLILPILRALTPLIEGLAPVVEAMTIPLERLADGISILDRSIRDMIDAIPHAIPAIDSTDVADTAAFRAAFMEGLGGGAAAAAPTTPGVGKGVKELAAPAPSPPPAWVDAFNAALASARLIPPIIPPGTPPWAVAMTTALNNLAQKTEQAAALQKSLTDQLMAAQGMSSLDVSIANLDRQFGTSMAAMDAELAALKQTAATAVNPVVAAGATTAATNLVAMMSALAAKHEEEKKTLEILNKQLEIQKKMNKAQELAAGIIKGTQSPLQQFQQQMDQINQLAASGNLNAEQVALASAQAFQTLQDSLPKAPETGPAALSEGSVAAVSLINKAMRQNLLPDKLDQVKAVLQQALAAQTATATSAAETARALTNIGVVTPARLR